MSATDLGDPDQTIHIPARHLIGTREAKLAELDMFLAQLQLVRLAPCGRPVRLDGFVGAARQATRDRYGSWARLARRLRAVLNAFGAGSSSHQKTDWS